MWLASTLLGVDVARIDIAAVDAARVDVTDWTWLVSRWLEERGPPTWLLGVEVARVVDGAGAASKWRGFTGRGSVEVAGVDRAASVWRRLTGQR